MFEMNKFGLTVFIRVLCLISKTLADVFLLGGLSNVKRATAVIQKPSIPFKSSSEGFILDKHTLLFILASDHT